MASVNKVILVGNLGNDPDVHYGNSGNCITRLSVATTEKWKDKDGERQEKTSWHRVVAFGRLAEIMGEYLSKGSPVYIEGRLSYGSYEKEGVTHYTTDIVADNLQMLGGRSDGQKQSSRSSNHREHSSGRGRNESRPKQRDIDDFQDDDIPF